MVNNCSLMKSIVKGYGSPTAANIVEASTVGIELVHHQHKDTTVEFFDCAGQVDYAGMHQTFLTPRALYLLVVDISKYNDLNNLDKVGGRQTCVRIPVECVCISCVFLMLCCMRFAALPQFPLHPYQ